ncbi:MAG: HNH endonuclease family protein [Candidatus Poribacteria bacterium]|nr:HNH endonuclease family protein [Candidatus Poribacteria bacterium]
MLLNNPDREILTIEKGSKWLGIRVGFATNDEVIQKSSLERELQELQELLVKSDEVSLILLRTNHDGSGYFANFLRNGTCPPVPEAKTLADRELLTAIHECQRFVDQWENPMELLRTLKNQLWFIFYQIHKVETVYTTFEVLNNRGLEVSFLERLKNRLMEAAFQGNQGNSNEHIDELHGIWGNFYRTVGLREGVDSEALTFAATLRSSVSKVLSEKDAVGRLIHQVSGSVAKTIEISGWLLKVVNTLNRLYEEMRQPVIKVQHARLLAVSIMLRDFPEAEERKLLNLWEKTSYLIFGLHRKDARNEKGNFIRLTCEIQNNLDLSSDDILKKIRRLSADYNCDIDVAYDLLYMTDCYNRWEPELRYLLCRYEEHLAKERGQTFSNEQWNRIWQESPSRSIEHISPQSSDRNYDHRHWLGNLLILPPQLNSQLGDKSPESKADDYQRTGLLIAADVAETIKKDGWGQEEIESRTGDILHWISDEFDLT